MDSNLLLGIRHVVPKREEGEGIGCGLTEQSLGKHLCSSDCVLSFLLRQGLL